MNTNTPHVRLVAAALGASLPLIANAAGQDFTIDSVASSTAGSLGTLTTTDGSLIGDFDADTNPGGTQTRPGFFGGSGNNPIPVSLDISTDTVLDLNPAGAFGLDADTSALTFMMDGLMADLLNGETVVTTAGLELIFSTFNTVNPSSIYPGGIPLPVEIEAGELSTIMITQTGPMDAPGVLIPQLDNSWILAGAIPAQFTIAGSGFGGAGFEPAPSVFMLPITGTYVIDGDGGATVTISLDLAELSNTVDTTDLPPLPEFPFALPTLGGDTASVLFSLALTSIAVNAEGSMNLVATADAAGCNAADVTEPFGVLDLSDLSAFVNAFGMQAPAADLDNNGVYDLTDIQLYVTTFLAGCP